ncbi:MAG: hypothetical protein CVV42_08125 [Candidatus Riflebacteria bacterium HGW-Riflebacteria-2]|jgi:hypothetical protein|nr:MAG: hypothetical protein CVV42_08125 [Candidatus Riflebacteria bacterium HGW-Riflebacteria-2]
MDKRWPFFTVDVELTNICEQNCRFCPREKLTRPSGFIDTQLLHSIMRQLAEIGSRVTFCGMGNPLLHPQWAEICTICHASGVKYGLTIQAPALIEANISKICELRPAFIEVSFPSIDSGHFARIYPGENLASSLNSLNRLVAARGSARGIIITAVRTTDDPTEPAETLAFWQQKGLLVRIQQCHSRGGNLHGQTTTEARRITSCGLFATHSFITWQGLLLACCHDLAGATAVADLRQLSLDQAAAAKIEILQKPMPWPICANCDEPAAIRPLPDRPFPATEKARSRYLKRLCASDQS